LRVSTPAACALSAPRMTADRLSHDLPVPAGAQRKRLPHVIPWRIIPWRVIPSRITPPHVIP
jgi:hypothetical protein